MEALALDVLVVSSDFSQIRSVFGDSVWYVDGGDAVAVEVTIWKGADDAGSTFQWERTVRESTEELEAIVDD